MVNVEFRFMLWKSVYCFVDGVVIWTNRWNTGIKEIWPMDMRYRFRRNWTSDTWWIFCLILVHFCCSLKRGKNNEFKPKVRYKEENRGWIEKYLRVSFVWFFDWFTLRCVWFLIFNWEKVLSFLLILFFLILFFCCFCFFLVFVRGTGGQGSGIFLSFDFWGVLFICWFMFGRIKALCFELEKIKASSVSFNLSFSAWVFVDFGVADIVFMNVKWAWKHLAKAKFSSH